MAANDLVPAPASVALTAGKATRTFDSGEAFDAGDSVYLDTTTTPNTWKKLDSSITGVGRTGIALASAPGPNQPVGVAEAEGDCVVKLGSTTSPGQIYVASVNSGKICPHSDALATEIITFVGYGNDNNEIVSMGLATGIARVP